MRANEGWTLSDGPKVDDLKGKKTRDVAIAIWISYEWSQYLDRSERCDEC